MPICLLLIAVGSKWMLAFATESQVTGFSPRNITIHKRTNLSKMCKNVDEKAKIHGKTTG